MRKSLFILISMSLLSGCVHVPEPSTGEQVLAERSSGASHERICAPVSSRGDRLLLSWEPDYWRYEAGGSGYYYTTNGMRRELPFLADEETYLGHVTPMGARDWFGIRFGRTQSVCIFNENGLVRSKPFMYLDGPIGPKGILVRFLEAPAGVEIWFQYYDSSHSEHFNVYRFDGELNLVERRKEDEDFRSSGAPGTRRVDPLQNLSDREVREKLFGTWIVNLETAGLTIKGTFTFGPDGTFSTTSTFTSGRKKAQASFEGVWEVKDRFLVETVWKTSNSTFKPVGSVTRDYILKLDAKEFSFRTEQGLVDTRRRKE